MDKTIEVKIARVRSEIVIFTIILRPSEWDWDDARFIIEPFWLPSVIFLRFGLGGPWGCIGIEIDRPRKHKEAS